ncbi:MAG: spore coat U domain-containing protein [Proteobacteria bacterium]|nr:spore coat U domain-containing protein [Pseudomonadota bacterium]
MRLIIYLLAIILVNLMVYNNSYGQCTVSATNINFGIYDINSTTNLTSTGTISVTCSNDTNVVIAIGQSIHGGINPRRMKHSIYNDFLSYNIYQNAGMTTIWGDGTNGTTPMIINRIGRNKTYTYYGTLFAGQDVSSGTYNDSLTITITP